MKRIATLILMSLALASLAFAGGKERITVKVTARNDSNVAYSYAFVNDSYGVAQSLNLQGATFTLLLPNGDKAVVILDDDASTHLRVLNSGRVPGPLIPLPPHCVDPTLFRGPNVFKSLKAA